MTREEIARVIAEGLGDNFDDAFAHKPEWIDARGEKGGRFREINEPMQSDYLDAADLILSKLHQDAGNAAEPFFRLAREVINPVNGERPWHADSKDWMVVFSFAGQSITLGDLRRAAAADALERGSQVGDGWVLVPTEPDAAMVRAASESRAHDDEGPFEPLHDLLGFSGESKTWTVVREALRRAIAAAPAHGGGG